MYDQVDSLRGAGRQMDSPVPPDPAVSVPVILTRVRKLLAEHLPGMSCDRRRWREALAAPVKDPALERERLFVLGWLRWLEGEWAPAESLLAEAELRCQSAPVEEGPADLPPLPPGLLLARSAYWCARVRVLLGRADAIPGYESTMRRLGGSPQATAWYVDLLWRAGRLDRAEQVWKAVRANKRVIGCDEGPLIEARGHLRKGEPGPAEKLLREASPGSAVVQVERQLLLCWALTALRQADRAAEALRLACQGVYPIPALVVWRNFLQRDRTEPAELHTAAPGWREFVEAQRLRGEGKRQEAAALYRVALGHVAAGPFARFGFSSLGEEDPASVLASAPGLFFAIRCRAKMSIDRFRAREITPGEVLDALQQASNAGYQNAAVVHFRRLATALQTSRPTSAGLASLLDTEPEGAARRNAARVVLELAARRLSPGDALEVLRSLSSLATEAGIREPLGRQLLRLALLLPEPAILEEAASHLSSEPKLALAQALLTGEGASEEEALPASILWQAASSLGAGNAGPDWQEKVRALRAQPRYRGVAQALLLQEAASRGDLPAVGALLEEADAWRAFRSGPPHLVLRVLSSLAGHSSAHAALRRVLPRWLALWDGGQPGREGRILAEVAGLAPSGDSEAPPGVSPAVWFLHQAARAWLREDAVTGLAFLRRARVDDFSLSEEVRAIVEAALPALERRADAASLARCLPEAETPAACLVDLVDLLRTLPEGDGLLEAARRDDPEAVRSGLSALADRTDLPGRLHHHLALLAWRAANHLVEQDEPERAAPLWRQAWRSWLSFVAGSDGPAEAERGRLLDHLLEVHRRRINDLLALGAMEPARFHYELVGSLPGWWPPMAEKVERFRNDLATAYLLTTREAMRHGTIPEGWRADYERGLSLLVRLLSLEHDNVRLLTALVEVSAEWFFDLYNLQDVPRLREQVGRCTPFALHLARLVADRPGELPARSALAEFWKVRGVLESDPSRKIALYREALGFDPGNANVRELLAQLEVTDPEREGEVPERSDDA
jgi:hypothetical protein